MKSSSLQRLKNLVAQKSQKISQPATSSEVSEVEDGKYRQDGNSVTTNSADTAVGNDNTYGSRYSKCCLIGTNYEDAVANLKLAMSILILGRRCCYQNYLASGFAVFYALVSERDIESWFSHYCLEPYPDVCRCGAITLGGYRNLRSHCEICKGSPMEAKIDSYIIQRLEMELGIHYSWLEYAAAWALSSIGGYRNE